MHNVFIWIRPLLTDFGLVKAEANLSKRLEGHSVKLTVENTASTQNALKRHLTEKKKSEKYSQKRNSAVSVPIFHIHVSVSDYSHDRSACSATGKYSMCTDPGNI
jgi:hypothetical protein